MEVSEDEEEKENLGRRGRGGGEGKEWGRRSWERRRESRRRRAGRGKEEKGENIYTFSYDWMYFWIVHGYILNTNYRYYYQGF